MHSRHQHRGLTWIDIESPQREEIDQIAAEFGITPLIVEELLQPTRKARSEFYPTYAYVVMHFPALRHTHKSREQEVDFVIGRDFLLTTHYDTVDPLHKFSKVFDVNAVLETDNLGEHAGFLFFYMLKKLYKSVEHEVEYIRSDMTNIEEHIFSGHEVAMVEAISRSSRDLLNMRQTIEPHRDILHELETGGPKFFGEDFLPYIRGLSNEYYRIHNHVMRETESIHELRETNNSLLSTKQNETMKVLTVMAFVTLPLSLIASIFGMNTQSTPIIGMPYDFWIVLCIMALAATSMLLYFKHKRWF